MEIFKGFADREMTVPVSVTGEKVASTLLMAGEKMFSVTRVRCTTPPIGDSFIRPAENDVAIFSPI